MKISMPLTLAVTIMLSVSCAQTNNPANASPGGRPDIKTRFHELHTIFMTQRRNNASPPGMEKKFHSARDAYHRGEYDVAESLLDEIENTLGSASAYPQQSNRPTNNDRPSPSYRSDRNRPGDGRQHTTATPQNPGKHKSNDYVTYNGTIPCAGGVCHSVDVTCEGIPARNIQIKQTDAKGKAGTVFMTTGGRSNMLYSSQSREQRSTTAYLNEKGYQVIELAWLQGWPKNAEGRGFKDAMCGYEKVVRWAVDNLADNKQTVCAQGNSAGGFQIAYGLAVYGMEDIFDAVILSGGPPASRFDVSCFGTSDPELQGVYWTDGTPGLGLIDIAMGWARNGDYCKSRRHSKAREKLLQDTSLASPSEPRDYHYSTNVLFVNSEADYSKANTTGRIYYDAIRSEKQWHEIDGTEHNVDQTSEGAQLIRELMVKECR